MPAIENVTEDTRLKMARNPNKRNAGGAKGAAEILNYSPAGAIFHWADPVASGVVLVSGLLVLIALGWYSVISIVSNLLLLGVLLGVGCKVYVHLMGMLKKPCKDPLAQLAVLDVSITEDCIRDSVVGLVDGYNYAANELRRLLLGEDLYDSLKFGLLVYLGTILGAIFTNTLVLLGMCWVLSFVLPKIYEDNQDCIGDGLCQLKQQYTAVDQKLASFFPRSKVDQVEVVQFEEEKKQE